MGDLIRQAGFLAAHGIWSVSDQDSGDLIPMVAYGDNQIERWVGVGDPKAHFFDEWLPGHPEVTQAVCAYDGYLTLPELPRTDTIYLETVDRSAGLHVVMGIPYRPASNPKGFAVFRPKLVSVEGIADEEFSRLMEHFWAGVDSHTMAAPVWNAALDQSM